MDTVNTGPEEAAGDSPAGDTPDTVPEAPAGQTQPAAGPTWLKFRPGGGG
jgi:hypothetical protein